MAKRYFNIFKRHMLVMMLIIVFIMASAFTNGTASTATAIGAGILLIGSAIRYAIWLLKTPGVEIREENL